MKLKLLLFLIIILFGSAAGAWDQININFSHPPDTPYFVGQPEMNIDAEEFTTVVLRIKAPAGGPARLFWATNFDPQMNQPKSIWFYLSKSSGPKEYVFNLRSQNQYWAGFVGQLLFYPNSGSAEIEVVSARAVPPDIISDIRSGWQEFWGPNGREVIGSTINLIPSSALFGRPINVYLYWLTGIFFLAAFAWLAIKGPAKGPKNKKDKSNVWLNLFQTAGRWGIYFALVGWALLGVNADLNYLNISRDNYNKYFGRNIEQKRAIAYGQDYYDFLVFARDKLPAEPVYFGVLSSRYAADMQARISLVPHILDEPRAARVTYLLVFYPDAKQLDQLSGFTFFAGLDKNAYILKRTK